MKDHGQHLQSKELHDFKIICWYYTDIRYKYMPNHNSIHKTLFYSYLNTNSLFRKC